jgi:hypothetical protein
MGKLLDKVIKETAKLPDAEQEAFAAFMLAELESEWKPALCNIESPSPPRFLRGWVLTGDIGNR